MRINCREFLGTKSKLRIYNLNPWVLSAVDIYYIGEDASSTEDLLTPNSDNEAKFNLVIDGNIYPITKGAPGEGPKNPIVYKKSIVQSKIKISNKEDAIFTGIGGSNNSDVLGEWVAGTNLDEIDDSILIEIDINSLPIKASKLYGYGAIGYGTYVDNKVISYGGYDDNFIINGGTIVVEISSKSEYNMLYHDSSTPIIGTITEFGYGMSAWGGATGEGQESYGGIVI